MKILGAGYAVFPLFLLVNFRKKFDIIYTCFPSLNISKFKVYLV